MNQFPGQLIIQGGGENPRLFHNKAESGTKSQNKSKRLVSQSRKLYIYLRTPFYRRILSTRVYQTTIVYMYSKGPVGGNARFGLLPSVLNLISVIFAILVIIGTFSVPGRR
jgi:hypothetical protein